MERSRVAVRKVGNDPVQAVREVLGCFDDAKSKLIKSSTVFIKINAVWHHQHLFTSLPIIEAAVAVIREHGAGKKIFIMDNCSQGNFTRHCFAATSIAKEARKMGAKCLYLDEEKPVAVSLREGSDESYEFPGILYRHLVENREDSFYLNLPVLKAHCQAQMTAGLKNQMGLLYDADRARHHNRDLHHKIVDIYAYIQPDFTLVDAIKVVARGPMPAGRYVAGLLRDRDMVFGGTDTVAVDAVAARVLGHEPHEIKHVKLAAEQGLGIADMDAITIDGDLPPQEKVPWEFEAHLPSSIRFVVGRDGACYEGCLGHAEQTLELVVNESGTPEELEGRPLTILTGKGFDDEQLAGLQEPVMVLGKCACKEVLPRISDSYKVVDELNTCGHCDNILNIALRRLGVSAFAMSPVKAPKVGLLFVWGKLNGLRYSFPR
ncbi:MAG: DUF362 domain-containing protein [Actinomycetota bacterium]